MEKIAAKNKELARAFWNAVWTDRDLELVSTLLSDDITYHSPRVEVSGKEKYLDLIRGYLNVFEDAMIIIDDMIAENDKVYCNVTFEGVQTGDFAGITATHKRVQFQLMDLLQVEDGKIINEWEIYDELGLMQQLGLGLAQKEHSH